MTESRLQQEIVIYFNNTYPHLRGLLCYNNNNSENAYRGKKNKFLGLIQGRSDLVLYYGGRAIMIELKTLTGRQSAGQKLWQAQVVAQGFRYEIVRELEEFKEILWEIMKE